MRSFDPIDIVFIVLIGTYLLTLGILIFILFNLNKDYDDSGNKVANDNKYINWLNDTSNKIIAFTKKYYHIVVEFIYEKLPKKEEVENNKVINKKENVEKTVVNNTPSKEEIKDEKEKTSIKKNTKSKNSNHSKKNTSNNRKNTGNKNTVKKNNNSKRSNKTNGSNKNSSPKKSNSPRKNNNTSKKTTSKSK